MFLLQPLLGPLRCIHNPIKEIRSPMITKIIKMWATRIMPINLSRYYIHLKMEISIFSILKKGMVRFWSRRFPLRREGNFD